MRTIIIGAGRGSRLNSVTADQPKCYALIGGRRILDWMLEVLEGAGMDKARGGPVFIGGYQIERIRRDYPHLTYCHNADWRHNNILMSLFCAEPYMVGGFVCSYSDILYRDTAVQRAIAHDGDIVLCVDTHWQDRYTERSQHPEADAEKVVAEQDRVVRIDRDVLPVQASGEYIGVAKFTARGAAALREHFHRARGCFTGQPWRGARVFEKAYLIELLQDMIEQGVAIHLVTTTGQYMEIDTDEDHALANLNWPRQSAPRDRHNG